MYLGQSRCCGSTVTTATATTATTARFLLFWCYRVTVAEMVSDGAVVAVSPSVVFLRVRVTWGVCGRALGHHIRLSPAHTNNVNLKTRVGKQYIHAYVNLQRKKKKHHMHL
jgi:hypothetical protein